MRKLVSKILLKSKIGSIIIRILIFIWSLLPYKLSVFLMGKLILFISRFLKKEREIMEAQIKYVINYLKKTNSTSSLAKITSQKEIENLIDNIFFNAGKMVSESLSIKKILSSVNLSDPNSKNALVREEKSLIEISDIKKGAIVLSAHFSCFELLAAYYVKRGISLTVVGRAPNYKIIDTLVKDIRASYGTHTLWREQKGSSKQLLRSLKNNHFIAVLIDQDFNLENEFVPFFGLEAAYAVGPIKLAVKRNIPIFCTWIKRNKDGTHHTLSKKITYDTEDTNVIYNILLQYSKIMEEVISNNPSEWIWWHRRWRRRPNINYKINKDSLMDSKEYVDWLNSLN